MCSQLLDLLLEANGSSRIPPHLRYDLRPETPSESAVPGLEPDVASRRDIDPSSARAALEEARTELRNGLISVDSYRQLEAALGGAVGKSMSLSQLNRTLHTTLESLSEDQLPHDLADEAPAGYLSLEHEEDYLNALDAALEGRPIPDSHPIRSNEREKDMALRNPMSVYNWLRKHQPQVFLQDSDSSADKPVQKPAGTAKAPRRSNIVPKQETEIIDEEGFLLSGTHEAPLRSKRKREDEPYRPKGGSSRPSKRKRASAGNAGNRDTGDDEGY
jgi:hypothetical protein